MCDECGLSARRKTTGLKTRHYYSGDEGAHLMLSEPARPGSPKKDKIYRSGRKAPTFGPGI